MLAPARIREWGERRRGALPRKASYCSVPAVELSSKRPAELRSVWSNSREYSRDAALLVSAGMSALPVVLLLTMAYARRWVTEDAFINLRVVQHVLAGHGLVFNAGERVEAFTSPLWVAILTAWGALGGPLESGSVALGLIASGIGLVLAQTGAWRLACRLQGESNDPASFGARPIAVPLGAAIFAAIPVAWDFTTSGLEGGLTTAWLGGTFWLIARGQPIALRDARLAAFSIGCGPLIRPDLTVFSVGFGIALILTLALGDDGRRRIGRREWTRLAVIAAALPASYQVFRMGYFAALVPNTALAKEAMASNWIQGWRYTVDFAGTYLLWIPVLIVAAWAATLLPPAIRAGSGSVALVLAPMLAGVVHWLYVTRVGGDFMHGRLLLPSLFGFLLPVATVMMPRAALRSWRGLALAAAGAWVVVCAIAFRVPYSNIGVPGPNGIADERGFYTYHMKTPNPVSIDAYLRHWYIAEFQRRLARSHRTVLFNELSGLESAGPMEPSVPASVRVVLGLRNVGVLGYLAGPGVHLSDLLGLGDPIGSRLVLTERGRPGHEKLTPDVWVIARFGDHEAARARFPSVSDAGRAMGCGDLARLLHAISDPLTPSRFLANVAAAWHFHRMRIPADPAEAARQFCSPAGRSSATAVTGSRAT
jgi:arabinofuranosyltransferase